MSVGIESAVLNNPFLSSGFLPLSGGTLSGNVNFTTLTSVTTNPAAAGQMRLAKTDTINFRNNANTGDVTIGLSAADEVSFSNTVRVNLPTADAYGLFAIGSTTTSIVRAKFSNSNGTKRIEVLNDFSGTNPVSQWGSNTSGEIFLTFYSSAGSNGGNVVVGGATALNTASTDGFLHIQSCAGAPTGVATTYTGKCPIVIDSTDSKLYVYIGSTWKSVTLS